MEKTIKVTGKGNISVKPDMIRLLITLEGMKESYDETLELHTEQIESLAECFAKLGFARTELKTLSFHVDTEYENYNEGNNVWKKRFKGYKFVHVMKLEFEADNKMLGRVLYALANSQAKPEFRICYTVRDIEAVKNALLGKAVGDSKQKAEVLAKAAGVKLGDILTIDYSWGEVELISTPMSRMALACASVDANQTECFDLDMEPDDMIVTDTVTVVWKIG